MAKFDITEIEESTITTDLAGKIIGLVGLNNTGKSYVSARLFPGQTLWLATEKGYSAQSGLRPYDIEVWDDFRDAVSQLTTRNKKKREKVREMYKCVVVDVADRLPSLCNSYIINQYNIKNSEKEDYRPISEISEIPFGGGYASLNKEIDTQINKLALSGYCVVLIFHEEIRKIKENGVEREYIVPKSTFNRAGNCLKDIPDFMIRLESQGVDEEGNAILSKGYCVQHKDFFARSRFTACPPVIDPFTADNLKETVRIACEREAEIQGAKTVTYAEEEQTRADNKAKKTKTHTELIEMIEPVYKAIRATPYKSVANSAVNTYLGNDENGKPRKVSMATETDVEQLQLIYNELVNFAEDKNIDWEN